VSEPGIPSPLPRDEWEELVRSGHKLFMRKASPVPGLKTGDMFGSRRQGTVDLAARLGNEWLQRTAEAAGGDDCERTQEGGESGG
jgi:hypothetical protein